MMNVTTTATATAISTTNATLTAIPALFKDPERAAAEMVKAKQALDLATARVREQERHNAQAREQRGRPGTGTSLNDGDYQHLHALLQPLLADVERARAEFEVAFTIYQETARARDAQASQVNAEASVNAAKAVKDFTLWIAVATIVQAVVGAGLLFEGCAKVGPR
jgi:hypothetical protein